MASNSKSLEELVAVVVVVSGIGIGVSGIGIGEASTDGSCILGFLISRSA